MEIYDRFDFVCPTPRITILLLDSYSRPPDQMYLNIFQRKWKGGIDEKGMNDLKKQMMSGEFCDPIHNETSKFLNIVNVFQKDVCKMFKMSVSKHLFPHLTVISL
jgi:hypothetical protein